jgi:hypothetical protein
MAVYYDPYLERDKWKIDIIIIIIITVTVF